MKELVRRMRWAGEKSLDLEKLVTREWLVTNGLGGYASGTVGGVSTRRYHGFLIASLPAPLGRVMMLNHLSELVRLPDGSQIRLGGEETVSAGLEIHGAGALIEFRLELGLPVWVYRIGDLRLEKRLFMPYRHNTVHIHYRLVGEGRVRLKVFPSLHFRGHDDLVSVGIDPPCTVTASEDRLELSSAKTLPPLRMRLWGDDGAFTVQGRVVQEVLYRTENSRGYDYRGDLWRPGHFKVDLSSDRDATLTATTEPWDICDASSPDEAREIEIERRRRLVETAHPEARQGFGAELVLASDQFIITPAGRVEDTARAHAEGDEVRTVIAGYHWFTDWGRDTMISLEGLTLTTGRTAEAGYILRTFAHYVKDGLIPNMFPEGEKDGLYHTADATLWFFHAIDRYIEVTGDRPTLRRLLPTLEAIVQAHLKGTRFGIRVDPADGLLRQGQEGYQLTWMDAKMGDWVVTPRRGKAVEINALWYNALRLLERWLREEGGGGPARAVSEHADRARESFNRRFWYGAGGYLYDVIENEAGIDDPACRPNQIFAISLANAVLEESRWKSVVEVVKEKLLTPVGLRSLSRDHKDYKPQYFGDLRTRDGAYHQGTVWAWLIGPFVDAWLRVYPDDLAGARAALEGFDAHLNEACIGSISEVFDAEAPFTARGCCAQAWSVAEVLRVWTKTAGKG